MYFEGKCFMKPVKLKEIVDEMEMQMDEYSFENNLVLMLLEWYNIVVS